MGMKILLVLAVIVAITAAVVQYDLCGWNQTIVAFMHHSFMDMFQVCPYHLMTNLMSKLGLAKSSDLSSAGFQGYSLGGVEIIRYQDDYLFTKEELSRYKGDDGSLGLYIGILGRVYDVSKGEQHYGPGNAYHFFTGCDGTKAFMSGEFNERGLIDDATGLLPPQMRELDNWIDFYEKTYVYKGKVIGNFYDEKGEPSPALHEALQLIDDAHRDKQKNEDHKRKFPPCNSAHTSDGGWVSCSNKSGGIQRDWIGVPRKYHTPGGSGSRCVCVRTEGPPYDNPDNNENRGELDNPHLEEYKDCDPTSDSCQII